MLRNAGGLVTDDVVRSLAISQHALGTREVMVVQHTNCGMHGLDENALALRIEAAAGTPPDANVRFGAFTDLDTSVRAVGGAAAGVVAAPAPRPIRGFVYDVETGQVREVIDDPSSSRVVVLCCRARDASACSPLTPVTRTVTYSIAIDGAVDQRCERVGRHRGGDLRQPAGLARRRGSQFHAGRQRWRLHAGARQPAPRRAYDPVCSFLFSCTVGRNVVINDFRFALRLHRVARRARLVPDMVINHETGHWFGLGHVLRRPGQPAPIMQQQSIGMQGCAMNSWPLKWELDLVR